MMQSFKWLPAALTHQMSISEPPGEPHSPRVWAVLADSSALDRRAQKPQALDPSSDVEAIPNLHLNSAQQYEPAMTKLTKQPLWHRIASLGSGMRAAALAVVVALGAAAQVTAQEAIVYSNTDTTISNFTDFSTSFASGSMSVDNPNHVGNGGPFVFNG